MKLDFKVKAIAFVTLIFAGLLWLNWTNVPETVSVPAPAPEQKAQTQTASEHEIPMAPAFTLENIDGGKLSLADYKGKVVFVNFWATWCPPCRAEIPHFVELVDKYGKDGFAIIGISVDAPKDIKKIPGFKKEYNINYPIVLANGQVVNDYGGIRSIPTTFVVDREGKALGKIVGSRSKEQFEEIVKQVL